MDQELLMCLIFLWTSTTTALVIFLRLWFGNSSTAFHPHAVDVDKRHSYFLVVQTPTVCKVEFVVKSISAFVAPRGASSSKWFTSLIIAMSFSGMFGAFRWYRVGDAKLLETLLAFVGFLSLLLLSSFESDVSSDRFLEDKLLVTRWLLQRLGAHKILPFSLGVNSRPFREFLRQSPGIYMLYEEDHKYVGESPSLEPVWPYETWWCSLHILGAVSYVILVPSAIIIHDLGDDTIANGVITACSFIVFCLIGYLTGSYIPVVTRFQCIILSWNPFLKQRNFLHNLQQAVLDYLVRESDSAVCSALLRDETTAYRRNKQLENDDMSRAVFLRQQYACLQSDACEEVFRRSSYLRFARERPQEYLWFWGHILVMTELVAVLTPAVAIGIQWVTALCPGPAIQSIIGLLITAHECVMSSDCRAHRHCILDNESITTVFSEL